MNKSASRLHKSKARQTTRNNLGPRNTICFRPLLLLGQICLCDNHSHTQGPSHLVGAPAQFRYHVQHRRPTTNQPLSSSSEPIPYTSYWICNCTSCLNAHRLLPPIGRKQGCPRTQNKSASLQNQLSRPIDIHMDYTIIFMCGMHICMCMCEKSCKVFG